MKQLTLKQEVSTNLESAVDEVLSALRNEDFGIISKLGVRNGKSEFVLIRSWYPRSECVNFLENPCVGSIVRCSILLRKNSPGRVCIEICQPGRTSISLDATLSLISQEASFKLQRVFNRVVEALPPPAIIPGPVPSPQAA